MIQIDGVDVVEDDVVAEIDRVIAKDRHFTFYGVLDAVRLHVTLHALIVDLLVSHRLNQYLLRVRVKTETTSRLLQVRLRILLYLLH